jgi:ABC-type transport system involved in multi-copper enzyme maturation permease subunit
MTQTLAILLDGYREINSRKLFWITLILSGLVVAAFGMIGINENGLRLLFWDVPSPMLNSKFIKPDVFYKGMFTSFGIGFWLAWLATILALVSTASIFPDLISSGSVDLVLSKPISRWRLFFTKFVTGLLFVGLQVTVFSIGSFLVIGLRGGTWEPGILLAIPLVLCFFSYLFSVCVLIGLLTRSTIAALLLTLLIWLLFFGVHTAESLVLWAKISSDHRVALVERDINRLEMTFANAATNPAASEPSPANSVASEKLAQLKIDLEKSESTRTKLVVAHRILFAFKTVMPKTSETIDLLEKTLVKTADLPELDNDESGTSSPSIGERLNRAEQRAVQKELIEVTRSRSVAWVVGTSLLFELLMLGWAGWVFSRRDF